MLDGHLESAEPACPPLSEVGRDRRDAIFEQMVRASRRRRARAVAFRAGAAAAVCCAVGLLAWLGLSPSAPRGGFSADAAPTPRPIPAPVTPVPVRPVEVAVVARYIEPQAGITDRFDSARLLRPAVVAQPLSDAALSGVLAEQTDFGIAEVRGRVLVLDNRPEAGLKAPVH